MRRYFLHYYLSWNGWNEAAPAITREAFKLKRLVSVPLWRGQLVHYIASKVLQSMQRKGRMPDSAKVVEYMRERFNNQLAFSKSKRYLTEPKKRSGKLNIDWLALLEHEYDRTFDPGLIDRAWEECLRAVEGLMASPILKKAAKADPSAWIIEDLDHAEFSQNFIFNGVTVYVKTDFIFTEPGGELCIVDWKTTKGHDPRGAPSSGEPDAEVQLGVYAYYAATVLEIPIEKIRLYEVNLLRGGAVAEHDVRDEMIERFKEHISTGIEKLSSVLVDRDRERNEPLAEDRFPRIANGRCRTCNFFRICKDERSAFVAGGAP